MVAARPKILVVNPPNPGRYLVQLGWSIAVWGQQAVATVGPQGDLPFPSQSPCCLGQLSPPHPTQWPCAERGSLAPQGMVGGYSGSRGSLLEKVGSQPLPALVPAALDPPSLPS